MPDFMTKHFMEKYGRSGTCADDVSEALSLYLVDPETGKTDPEKIKSVADNNKISLSKWDHLNAGQRRMLLGNVLRGKIRRGGKVQIGDQILTGVL